MLRALAEVYHRLSGPNVPPGSTVVSLSLNGNHLQKVHVSSPHHRKPQTKGLELYCQNEHHTPLWYRIKKIIVRRRFEPGIEAKHAMMNTTQGCHRARPASTKRPCLSNLTPSSLSMRNFQSQWDTIERLLSLDPGLCFSPQNPPIVRFEAMIL